MGIKILALAAHVVLFSQHSIRAIDHNTLVIDLSTCNKRMTVGQYEVLQIIYERFRVFLFCYAFNEIEC